MLAVGGSAEECGVQVKGIVCHRKDFQESRDLLSRLLFSFQTLCIQ